MAFIIVCGSYMSLARSHLQTARVRVFFCFCSLAALLRLLHRKQQLYSLTPTTKLLQMVNNFVVSFTVDAASQLIMFMYGTDRSLVALHSFVRFLALYCSSSLLCALLQLLLLYKFRVVHLTMSFSLAAFTLVNVDQLCFLIPPLDLIELKCFFNESFMKLLWLAKTFYALAMPSPYSLYASGIL